MAYGNFNYFNRGVTDDPYAIDPSNPPNNPNDGTGTGGGGNGGGTGGSTGGYGSGTGGRQGYDNTGGGSGGNTSGGWRKNPWSPEMQSGAWWGQLPYYMEKSFLEMKDRGSNLYTSFQNQLMKSLGGQFSTNSLLGMNLAMGGGGFGGSQFLANEKMKQMQGKASDTAVGATDQFYSGMQGQAGSMLNLMLQDRTSLWSSDTQKRLAEMGQSDIWTEMIKGLSSGAGFALTKSDIRAKENIKKVGAKNGVDIVEFNYKNNPTRYRGVIAQQVEEVYPNAVTEINGIKYVDYSQIGIPFEEV